MGKSKSNNLIIGCLCALGCETIFGLSYIFTKTGTEVASAFALLGWRFFIAIVILSICVLFGFMKMDLKGKPLKPLFAVALFNPFVYFIGETIGISNTTASESGVFLACIPVVSLVASTLVLKKFICQEKVDTKKHHSFRSPVRSCTELGFCSPKWQQDAGY